MVHIPQHWSLRREYSQDKSGNRKTCVETVGFYQARWWRGHREERDLELNETEKGPTWRSDRTWENERDSWR
ncbi:hypothetical protein TNCV_5135151 [Trichonephila clavipes]|nr:hypothetical protein TNCV_5135151 [Trichonephila clavipes]